MNQPKSLLLSFNDKILESKNHILRGDLSIGYRKMLDCVLDFADSYFYQQVINIENYKEMYPEDTNYAAEKSIEILDALQGLDFKGVLEQKLILRATGISKSYGNRKFNLGPIDLEIHSGDLIGLVGENGNGKTTLLRMLAKELSLSSGRIFFGLQEKTGNPYDLRTKLIYIPQRTPTWYGPLIDNLKYAAAHYGHISKKGEELVNMMMIRFGLWKYRKYKWSELSSGYKMRFELARTFLRSPEILLLDEPLANLDILAQQLILEDLKSISKSIRYPMGIILSSQQLFEVEKVSDEVIFLRNGKPTQLNNTFENLKDYWAIEIESANSREQFDTALEGLDIKQLQFNGGMYHIEFPSNISPEELLKTLIDNGIEISYFRNISKSTKRLFVK